jgi:nucleoside-diphosphate-sugar epimerase
MEKRALIVGASGVVGRNLAEHLLHRGWQVAGLSRHPAGDIPGLQPITADLLDAAALGQSLSGLRASHVYITSWMRQDNEKRNIEVNSALVRNLLHAVAPAQSVQHVALVTGLKHYLGPFEAYGKGALPATPFREDQARLEIENFYYAQEDEVFAAAERAGFTWSVHRPHTIVGFALGNAMNMGSTLAAYASLCREYGRPFLFPGSATQWNSLTDMTDARLLAQHLEWASVTAAARNQAFNVVNGDVFRWNWMWPKLADYFGLTPAPYTERTPLEEQLRDAAPLWSELAGKYQLIEPDLARLTSAWHTDADLGRPIEVLTDMTKSRKLGFLQYQSTLDSFTDLFDRMREARLIQSG